MIRSSAARRVLSSCLAVALCTIVVACGEDQDPWCSELQRWSGLDALATAISSGDAQRAAEELDGFDELAKSAPPAIRPQLTTVSNALADSVAVALDDGATDPDELELQRDELNQRLGRLTTELRAVSSYAEQECGIRLDE